MYAYKNYNNIIIGYIMYSVIWVYRCRLSQVTPVLLSNHNNPIVIRT